MLKLNGILVRQPRSMSVGVGDLDDKTTRTASGSLTRDRIAVKRKLTLSWSALTSAELSEILEAVSSVFFQVTYPDPQTGTIQTKTFYVGDRTAAVYTYNDGVVLWENLNMNLIER